MTDIVIFVALSILFRRSHDEKKCINSAADGGSTGTCLGTENGPVGERGIPDAATACTCSARFYHYRITRRRPAGFLVWG
jgi:hypothetical protein